MRVLVTGAAGQVGSEAVRAFSQKGHDVVRTTRAELDITDRDSVMQAITTVRPDAVVHAAAFTAVDACEGDPERALLANALGTRSVADAARRVGAHVCYLSTDYVFRGDLDRPYHEWDETGPLSSYGRSKLGGERELSDGDTVVRTSWVFGRTGPNMVKTVLRLLADDPKRELRFVDDQHGHPTSAADLAGMLERVVTYRLPGTFHVTNQGATTWHGFVQDVVAAAGGSRDQVVPIKTADLDPPRPAPRPANSVLDNTALRLSGIPLLPHYREPLERLVRELLPA
ncbi:MAG: dTDP-4-dehydrorhamnose reductase [Acidimicrobiaceae bacterium]|jgi:dTDP-4-dehydrorhamnose reductase|nr:dTDP-4-dehydrorhamnose reductase [Acidimicrobiaceae bacterium]